MEKMPPASVPQGDLWYFLFRQSRSIEGVAWRRDGISPTLGMIVKRLIVEFSHILGNVGRAGASVIDRRGGVVR